MATAEPSMPQPPVIARNETESDKKQLMGEDADGFATRRGKLEAMGQVARAVNGSDDEEKAPEQGVLACVSPRPVPAS